MPKKYKIKEIDGTTFVLDTYEEKKKEDGSSVFVCTKTSRVPKGSAMRDLAIARERLVEAEALVEGMDLAVLEYEKVMATLDVSVGESPVEEPVVDEPVVDEPVVEEPLV